MSDYSEFEIIKELFSDIVFPHPALTLNVGDDAAVIQPPQGYEVVFSIDTQNADVHFPANAKPALIAQRALRAALSDLAAMGAEPLCFTLALSLPESDPQWLQSFSQGLRDCAKEFRCSLVGGDTTRGSLSVTIQVQGLCPQGTALQRNNAQVGDHIFVSGSLGGGAAYVELLQANQLEDKTLAHASELFSADYFSPQPRMFLGQALRSRAHSAIDVSDGLLADLNHICQASNVSASLYIDQLPCLPELAQTFAAERALQLALCGGDDYELCFTVAEDKVRDIIKMAEDMECPVTEIGIIKETHGTQEEKDGASNTRITCYHSDGSVFPQTNLKQGYQHF